MRRNIVVCMIVGIFLAIQFYEIQSLKSMILNLNTGENFISEDEELKFLAGRVAVEGEGIIITMNDSSNTAKAGENQNLYLIHDDDILRVINELRAAGAEAISINGQRLTAMSEIRCAGPTLSVNNVRSAPPYEISAIGDKKSLENSIKMRGGVEDTLKIWGIQISVETKDKIYIPAYKGSANHFYAKIAD